MERLTGYKTSDDTMFDKKADAMDHEIYLKCKHHFDGVYTKTDILKAVNEILESVKSIKSRK